MLCGLTPRLKMRVASAACRSSDELLLPGTVSKDRFDEAGCASLVLLFAAIPPTLLPSSLALLPLPPPPCSCTRCVCRYVTLPPCLWGSADEGLAPPSWLGPNTPMISIKRNRNTWTGHFGEMASWQMRGVPFPANKTILVV